MSMLPRVFPPFPERKEFELFAIVEPAKEVGGDFYDFFFVDKDTLCIIIGDVSGKGIPAALFMATSKTLLRTEALRGLSCDEIFTRVNDVLCCDNQACMFVTVLCLMLNTKTGEIQFSNAGHNPPLISTGGGPFNFINMPRGFVLGGMETTKCKSSNLWLKPNDIILLYTDGVTEAMNPQLQLFSEQRLKNCLSNLRFTELTELIDGVYRDITTFAQGAPQSDDITLLALRFNGQGRQ
jgi:sigma-B regulation protein RsbU (phosphoserine phosphatase)